MKLIASLPWYDLTATQHQLDNFWQTMRACLSVEIADQLAGQSYGQRSESSVIELPEQLDRQTPLDQQWQSRALLISQCCGPDLFTPQASELVAVARPVFSDLDCRPGNYFSHIVTAASPRSGKRLVVNSPSSRSGCNALLEWFDAQGWQADQYLVSGSHEASLQLIREGRADYAAIDAHSWNLLSQTEADNGVVIIDQSSEAPAPPYVTHRANPLSTDILLSALQQSVALNGQQLGIIDILPTDIEVYRSMQTPSATGWRCNTPLTDLHVHCTADNLPWQISCL